MIYDERQRAYVDPRTRRVLVTEQDAARSRSEYRVLRDDSTTYVSPSNASACAKLERPNYCARLRPVHRFIVLWLIPAFIVVTSSVYSIMDASRATPIAPPTTLGAFGYAEGMTQPRTFTIEDGFGMGSAHELARFEPTGNMTVNGAIHVNGECGVWSLDANTRSGWLFLPKADQCKEPTR